MGAPVQPVPAQGGWRQMPGGYDAATQQANGQAPQQQMQQVQQVPQPTQLGQPAAVAMPQGMQPQFDNMRVPAQPQNVPVQQPQFAPQQQVMPQQPQIPQQQFQPSMVPVQQQQPNLVAADPNVRLTGPSIPTELQGRTLGEALQMYSGMRDVQLRLLHSQGQAPQAVQPQQQQTQQLPQGQIGQQGQQPAAWDWRNPAPQIAAVVNQALDARLAPLLQSTNEAESRNARNAVAQEIGLPVFASLETKIMSKLQGLDAVTLKNPETWRLAANAALGETVREQVRMQQPGQQVPLQQNGYQPQQIPQGAQPIPNIGTFYTEQPNMGTALNTGVQLNANQMWAAQAMGMNPADYAAWAGGGR